MVAFPRLSPKTFVLNPSVPPIAGAVAGICVAMLFVALPRAVLENWVLASGIPALIAAAAPPLGTTARAVLALAGGAIAGSVAWSMLYLLVGPGGLLTPHASVSAMPAVRRADAHPDAPPRRPMTAADLGTPLMEVAAPVVPVVEQEVPADLDQPLAAFDPASIPEFPLTPSAPVPPLARKPIVVPEPAPTPAREPLAPGERIDTYVLKPPVPTAPPQPRKLAPQERPSIDALLRRLEEVTAQRMAMGR